MSADSPYIFCKGCGGSARRPGEGGSPAGWYNITVSVPGELNAKGFIWIGQFCCVACIARAVPDLRTAEELARLAYHPVMPSRTHR